MAAAGAMALLVLPATAGGDPTDVVRRAVARTLAAPYIAVEQRGQPQRLYSRTLMVWRRGGQVVLWTKAREEIRWNRKGRCYGRRTDFNRDDTRQMHGAIAPRHLRDIRSATRHGVPVYRARTEDSTDSADSEYVLQLDAHGRIAALWKRSARFGVIPPSDWRTGRLRYPSAAEFARLAGPRPTPRCH